MDIRIDGGCVAISINPDVYKYTVQTNDGEKSYVFSTGTGYAPDLGDTLTPGTLLGGTSYSATYHQHIGYIINNDAGKVQSPERLRRNRGERDSWPHEGTT